MEPDKFYHVYNRGNNRQDIFFEEANYRYFLDKYVYYLNNLVDTFAYCLMPNHFHLLIRPKALKDISEVSQKTFEVSKHTSEVFKTSEVLEVSETSEVSKTSDVLQTPLNPIDKAFRDFMISYVKSINKRFDRTGSLFQPKCKKKLIETDQHFTWLINYIHYNPVNAGLCKSADQWEFSSYNLIINNQPTFIRRDEILNICGNKEQFIDFHKTILDKEKINLIF